MEEELKTCPLCQSPYGYFTAENLFTCPECQNEWNPIEETEEEASFIVKDANGNILQSGDTVIVIKDLPLKGSSNTIKTGTKVKNIRLVDGDHNIDCKLSGFGAIGLKSEFVKKA